MSSVIIAGDTSGTVTLQAPSAAGSTVINLPTVTGGSFIVSDASGNVGIGTSSPTAKLSVVPATFRKINIVEENSLATIKSVAPDASDNNRGMSLAGEYVAFHTGASSGTSTTERARIDSSGNLLVSKTADTDSVAGTVITLVDAGGAGKHGKIKVTNTIGTGQYVLQCLNASGSTVGGVTSSSTATAFPTSSDYRLKENVQPMTGALSVVSQLKPCTYTWKADGSDGQGFIAHELQAVVPDAVVGEKDAVDADGNPVYQGIDTSFLVATLTAAIQELKAELDAAKADVAALKGQA